MRAITPTRALSVGTTPRCLVSITILFVLAALCPSAGATLRPMVPVWQDDFEAGRADGWVLQHYMRGDELRVADYGEIGVSDLQGPTSTIECVNSYALVGRSQARDAGAGYQGSSPTYEQMGFDPQQPHRVKFSYGIPRGAQACWTYALMSRYVSLVVTECNTDHGVARLAAVDDMTQEVVPLAWIPIGELVDVQVQMLPRVNRGVADVVIRLDGVVVAQLENRMEIPGRDRIVFADLPVRPFDVDEPSMTSDCFGSGVWDDVAVLVEEAEPAPRPRDIHFTLSPNPMNPRTEISMTLPVAAFVELRVFDLGGRHVATLLSEPRPAGALVLPWDGRDARGSELASGVYLVRALVDGQPHVQRVVIVR